MAETNRTSTDYKNNINEIYRLARANGVTKLERQAFERQLTTGPNYRSLIYNGLRKAGVEGIGANQHEFVQYVLPSESAARQVSAQKKKAAPAASTRQAAAIGEQAFKPKAVVAEKPAEGAGAPAVAPKSAQGALPAGNTAGTGAMTGDGSGDLLMRPRDSRNFYVGENPLLSVASVARGKDHEFMRHDVTRPIYDTVIPEKIAPSELERSGKAAKMVQDTFGKDIQKRVDDAIKAGDKAAGETFKELTSNTNPYGLNNAELFNASKQANIVRDPAKMVENIQKSLQEYMEANKAQFAKNAEDAEMSVEDYVKYYVAPSVKRSVSESMRKSQVARNMAKGDFDYVMRGVANWVPSMLFRAATETPSQFAYETEADEAYGEKAGMGATFGRGAVEFMDPTFAGAMGAGGAVGRGVVAGARRAAMKAATTEAGQAVVRKVGTEAMKRSVNYAVRFGTAAERRTAQALAANKGFVARTLSAMPGEIVGQGLGMNIYGAAQGGAQTWGSTGDIVETGKAVIDGLTSREGFVSGAAFAVTMPWLHGMARAVGYGKRAGAAGKFGGISLSAGVDALSVPATGMVMWLSNNANKAISGEECDWSGHAFLHETAVAAAMKINPLMMAAFKRNPMTGRNMLVEKFLNYGKAEGLADPRAFSDWDKEELLDATGAKDLGEVLYKIFPDTMEPGGNATGNKTGGASKKVTEADVAEAQKNFLNVMNNLSWDAQNKLAMALTNTMTMARPRLAKFEFEGDVLKELDAEGNVLSRKRFKSVDERDAYITEKEVLQTNIDQMDVYGTALQKNHEAVRQIVDEVAAEHGMTADWVIRALNFGPLRRSHLSTEAIDDLIGRLRAIAYPTGEVHVEASRAAGEAVASGADVLGDAPDTAAVTELNGKVDGATEALAEALKSVDCQWGYIYEKCIKEGMTDAEAYEYLRDFGFTEDNLTPLAEAINAKTEQDGFMNKVGNDIETSVNTRMSLIENGARMVDDKGTQGIVHHLVDGEGNDYVLVSGYIETGADGMLRSDMPVMVMDAEGNMHSMDVKGLSFGLVETEGEYAERYRQKLGERATAVIDPEGKLGGDSAAEPLNTGAEGGVPPVEKEGAGAPAEGGGIPDGDAARNETAEGEAGAPMKPAEPAEPMEPVEPVVEEGAGAPAEPAGEPQGTEGGVPPMPERREIPVREDGEMDYTADGVKAADAVNHIYREMGVDEKTADEYVNEQVENAVKAREKAEKDAAKAEGTTRKSGEGLNAFANRKKEAVESAKDALDKAKTEEDRWKAIRAEAEKVRKPGPAGDAAGTRLGSDAALAAGEVPDTVNDTPEAARERGYKMVNGVRYDRQEKVEGIDGRDAKVVFGKGDANVKEGKMRLVELDDVQESHKGQSVNPMHFIPEAQPKDRTSEASRIAARTNASKERFDPKLCTGDGTVYTDSNPVVNEHGEVIQGNGRVMMMREVYDNAEVAERYKEYLREHAEEFGLKAEDIDRMKKPVLVTELKVDDAEAIRLGQMTNTDLESGGTERIKPENTIKKMGEDFNSFMNILMNGADEDMSLAQLIDANGETVLRWMNSKGFITNTQYESAVKSGKLTAEAKNDLNNLLKQRLFEGAPISLRAQFDGMPAKAQNAILANYLRDMNVPKEAHIMGDIRHAIQAFSDLMKNADFAKATKYEDAKRAIENWKKELNTFESVQNSEKFSTFALELAARLKTSTMKGMSKIFDEYYSLVGDRSKSKNEELGMFGDDALSEPVGKAEAIKKLFNIDINEHDQRVQRGDDVAGNGQSGRAGERGGTGDASGGERNQSGEPGADGTGGTGGNGEERTGHVEGENAEAELPHTGADWEQYGYDSIMRTTKNGRVYTREELEEGIAESEKQIADARSGKIEVENVERHVATHQGWIRAYKELLEKNDGSGHTAANGEGGVLSLNGEEYAISDIEETVRGHVQEVIEEGGFDAEIVGVKVIGSYVRGEQRDDSDLDVLVEYKGKAKEDALFDALVDVGLEINGVTVDVNPITRGKSGTIEQFLKRNAGFSKVGGAGAQGVVAPEGAKSAQGALDDWSKPFEERVKGVEPLTKEEIADVDNKYVRDQLSSAIKKLEEGKPLSAIEQGLYVEQLKKRDNAGDTTQVRAGDSTDGDRAQLGEGADASAGSGSGGERAADVQVDRSGSGEAEAGTVRSGEDSTEHVHPSAGERGDNGVRGEASRVDELSAGREHDVRSGGTGSDGHSVRGGRGEATRPKITADAKRAEVESSLKANKDRVKAALERLRASSKTAGQAKNHSNTFVDITGGIATWIGKQAGKVDWEALGEFGSAVSDVGIDYIRLGKYKFQDWAKNIREDFHDMLVDTFDWKDAEVEDYINEMWNSNYSMDGEEHTLREWASILGDKELRKQIHRSLSEKRQAQKDAEAIEVKVGDEDNIRETLPYLLPAQQDDVIKTERQFFDESHQDREHGFGKGMMFTNGTGTGKTYTGLGIVKRFVKQGKGRVLIVTPSQTKVGDWVKDGKNLDLDIKALENTKDAGEGVVITTFANLRANEALLRGNFDLIVYDESHKIMENKEGEETVGANVHYMLTNKNVDRATDRLMVGHPLLKEQEMLRDVSQNMPDISDICQYSHQMMKLGDNASKLNQMASLEYGGVKIDKSDLSAKAQRALERFKKLKAEDYRGTVDEELFNELNRAYLRKIDGRQIEIAKEIQAERQRLKPEAEAAVKQTKTVFLSATPFNTRESLKYAEGYIFSYPEENQATKGTYNHRSPQDAFMEQHFSAGYRWRYGRLEQHVENADALNNQEIAFSDHLQNNLGTLSTRQIENGYDYSRTFPTVTFEKAERFNEVMQTVRRDEKYKHLAKPFSDIFYDYNKSTALFEAMKSSLVVERIKEHIKRGRKVVIFHRRRTTKDNLVTPFRQALDQATALAKQMKKEDPQRKEILEQVELFEKEYADLLEWEQGLDYRLPREQLAEALGEDKVGFFSGAETKKDKDKSIEDFLKDNEGKDVIVIQEASGKEGISLHDTTGVHERVLASLCLPQSPIAFIQIEGRIYRIGQKSNALFEYPLLGLDLEMNLFASQFNKRVGTTENLAMGSKGRNMAAAISRGVMENSGTIGYDGGVGGREFDGNNEAAQATGLDRAIQDYFTNQKLKGRRDQREGKDYFPTPEPLGYKMVEWAGLNEGETVLEPSAGHGAIARYVPNTNRMVMIEPSDSLRGKLQLNTPGTAREYKDTMFEDYNAINKHDVVLMNPPYGSGGSTAVKHVEKAFGHLTEGGRVIAIIPDGPSCEKKMNAWLGREKTAVVTAEIRLPQCTFDRAGTGVMTRVVVIDKVSRAEMRAQMRDQKNIDLRDVKNTTDLFERLRDVSVPERTIDKEFLNMKHAKAGLKPLQEHFGGALKNARLDPDGEVRISFRSRHVYDEVFNIHDLNGRDAQRLYERLKNRHDGIEDNDWRFPKKFGTGRGSKRVEWTEPEAVRDIYETLMKTVAKIAGKTTDQMEREVAARKNPSAQPMGTTAGSEAMPQRTGQEARWGYKTVKHTKTGADLHIVTSNAHMTDEEYKAQSARAKELGGFWDRYSKGFRFESKEKADAFMRGDTPAAEQQGTGALSYGESLNDAKKGRIVPEDVDKSVSSQIESDFDRKTSELKVMLGDHNTELIQEKIDGFVAEYSTARRSVIEDERQDAINFLKNHFGYETDSRGHLLKQGTGAEDGGRLQTPEGGKRGMGSSILEIEQWAIIHAADRELAYRDERVKKIAEELGLRADEPITYEKAEEIFKATVKDKEAQDLFDKVCALNKKLGIDLSVKGESDRGAVGEAATDRSISYYIDGYARTDSKRLDIAVSIGHEMVHQSVMGAIDLVQKGKAEGLLTAKQIEAVKTILDIYDKVKGEKERFSEEDYGLKDAQELAAQMIDPRQRKAMSLSIIDRVMNAAHQLKASGEKTVWQRLKDAFHALFETSDKAKMDKAIEDIMSDFNETVNDIAMADIEGNGWGYKIDPKSAELGEDDRKAVEELQSGKTKKVYRAMQVIDGKLYPPMAAKIGGEMVEGAKPGDILKADEHPEMIKLDKSGKPQFVLDKGGKDATGKKATSVPARYNPYWHTSNSMLNDQFKSAWIRPNMVVVEVEIPEMELTSGYKAEYAKDAVGMVPWKSGVVTGQLVKQGHPGREVYLSRYCKIGRVVPEAEAAEHIKEFIGGRDVEIPVNTVTPKLRAELEKAGVKIGAPEKGVKMNEQIEEALERGLEVDNSVRMRVGGDSAAEPLNTGGAVPSADAVDRVAKKMGVGVNWHEAGDEAMPDKIKAALGRGEDVKGWFDPKDGSVHFYAPNVRSRYDAMRTLWHESVGHKGLRKVMGDVAYNTFLQKMFMDKGNPLAKEMRRFVAENASRNGWKIAEALDEWFAAKAEEFAPAGNAAGTLAGSDASLAAAGTRFWSRVTEMFGDAVRALGYTFRPNVNDVRYLLWVSKRGLGKSEYNPVWRMQKAAFMRELRRAEYLPEIKDGEYVDAPAAKLPDTDDSIRTSGYPYGSSKRDAGDHYSVEIGKDVDVKTFPAITLDKKEYATVMSSIDSNHKKDKNFSMNTAYTAENGYLYIRKGGDVKIVGRFDLEDRPIVEQDLRDIVKNGVIRDRASIGEFIDRYSQSAGVDGEHTSDASRGRVGDVQSDKVHLRRGADVRPDGERVVSSVSEGEESGIRMRVGGGTPTPTKVAVRNALDKKVRGFWHDWKEAHNDNMKSVKDMMEAVIGGKIADIKDAENAYDQQNHATSIAQAEWDKYVTQKYSKVTDAVNACVGVLGGKASEAQKEVEGYLYRKHGLERNRVFFVRDNINKVNVADRDRVEKEWKQLRADISTELKKGAIDYREYLERMDDFINREIDGDYDPNKNDYSGINRFDENAVRTADELKSFDESEIIDKVMETEAKLEGKRVDALWEAIKGATDFSVDYSYSHGSVDKASRDEIKGMFDFYVPLRGFGEGAMEDVYEYVGGHGDTNNKKVIIKAKGRKSAADSPLAYISAMAETAINQGEQNIVKQKFYRFNVLHPNDKVIISEIWEEQQKDGTWKTVVPDVDNLTRPEAVAVMVNKFNERMEAAEKAGTARKVIGRVKHDLPFKNRANRSQHMIEVDINGRKKLMYVTGDPRLAQALNGQLENKDNSTIRKNVLRAQASFATSMSPEFILSNLSRDTFFTNANVAAKENAAYWAKYTENQALSMRLLVTGVGGDKFNGESLFEKYYNGRKPSTPVEKMFFEFMDNGGRTGFVAQKAIEQHKTDLRNEIKSVGTPAAAGRIAKKAMTLGHMRNAVEEMNMRAELVNRFAVYRTSRQMGRSIMRSVTDSKEVSVNFNRHGAGNAGQGLAGKTAGFMRNNVMFYNASMQALNLLGKNLTKDKQTALKTVMFMGAVPAMIGAAFASILGDDDDYNKIPHWDRRNNICIPYGDGDYLKFPLPIELRAFWGMGDVIASISNKKLQTENEVWEDMLGQLTQVLPIDVLNGGGNSLTEISGWIQLLPTYIQPMAQYVFNKDWTGKPIHKENKFNPDAPMWTLATNKTNSVIVKVCKVGHDMLREGKETDQATDPTGGGSSFMLDPTLYDHLLRAYLGGIYSMSLGVENTVEKLITEGKFDGAHAPFVRRLYGKVDNEALDQTTNAKFWAYKREADGVKKEYSNRLNKANPNAKNELNNSGRGKRYKLFDAENKMINKFYKRAQDISDPNEKMRLDAEVNRMRRELVDALDAIE